MSDMVKKGGPTYSDVHRSTPLTNISVAHAQANQGKYKAFSIFPAVGVMKKSDKFYVYNKGDLLRSQAARRAPGARVEMGSYRISDDSYECERWAIGKNIADPERDNADPQFDLDAEAVEFGTDQIALALENEFTTDFFTTGQWTGASSTGDMTGTAAGGSTASGFLQWNDVASRPIEDLRGEMVAVESRTGYKPNKLTLGARVWAALADHPDILDRIKYTQAGNFGPDLLASLLGLDEVVILNAVKNSANEGSSAASVNFIAGKSALLTYTTPAPGLKRPTAGYTFVWTAASPLQGASVKRYRVEEDESDRIEVEKWCDFKVVSAELGAFFASCVA